MYVTISLRRAVVGLAAVAVVVAVMVGWSYSVGHRDGVMSDRVEVCHSFGATDAPACVEIAAR